MTDLVDRLAPHAEGDAAPWPVATPTKFELHPCFVLRLAGEPLDSVNILSSGRTAALAEALAVRRARLVDRCRDLSARLGEVVPQLQDSKLIHRILAVRRSFFKGKPPDHADLHALGQPALQTLVDEAWTLEAELRALAAEEALLPEHYEQERIEGRARVADLFRAPNLNHGILQASTTLYRKLQSVYAGAQRLKEKDLVFLENAFLNYLLRAAHKTSPQSSFTPVALGVWTAGAPGRLGLSRPDWRLRHFLSIRPSLLQRLMQPLLLNVDALGDRCQVRLNPTLRVTGDQFTIIRINNDAVGANSDIIRGQLATPVQRRWSPPLQLVQRQVLAQDGLMPLGRLLEGLCAAMPGQAETAVKDFVAGLLKLQFLLVETGMEEQEPFLDRGQTFLAGLETAEALACGGPLERVSKLVSAWPAPRAEDRLAALDEIREGVEQFAVACGGQDRNEDRISPVNENCYLDGPPLAFDPAAIDAFRQDLELVQQLIPIVSDGVREEAHLTMRFLERFGPSGVCTDLIQFVLQVGQEFAFAEGPRRAAIDEKLREASPIVRQLDALAVELQALHSDDGDEIDLDRSMVADLVSRIPPEIARRSTSQTAIGQVFFEEGRIGFVLNQLYFGNSRLMSRYFEAAAWACDMTRDYLQRLSPGGRYLEVPGVYGFNVNMHPRLTDAEFSLPPFAPSYRETRKVSHRDLTLRFDPATSRVVLCTREGEPLHAYFLGGMNAATLPMPLRILDSLAGQHGLVWHPAFQVALARGADGTAIVRIPRLRLGAVCLSRTTWFVPRHELPDGGASESEFFFALQKFRRRVGLPPQVFVQFPRAYLRLDPSERDDTTDPNRLKPVFLDFSNIYCVRVFRRLLKSTKLSAIFTEVLPTPDDAIADVGGRRHAAELQMELARFAPP